jgi:hypothetical protein
MKRRVLLMALMLLGSANAGATDIAGKWGIGAALFNSGFETSLIHGHSNRTAWVFDVSLSGAKSDRTDQTTSQPDLEVSSNSWAIGAGPALRRFFRPESDFSPYGDLFVSGHYQHQHAEATGDPFITSQTINTSIAGVSTGLRFGLEYFTRWHCSIAADTNILQLGWDRVSDKSEALVIGLPPSQANTTDNRYFASFGVAPRLLVRAYF